MAWLGFSLDILTLLALAIVVGILVDDAIVEIDNIERHRHMGKSRITAAKDAVTEIALAVIATTMSIVAVFAPTAMIQCIPGMRSDEHRGGNEWISSLISGGGRIIKKK